MGLYFRENETNEIFAKIWKWKFRNFRENFAIVL